MVVTWREEPKTEDGHQMVHGVIGADVSVGTCNGE